MNVKKTNGESNDRVFQQEGGRGIIPTKTKWEANQESSKTG